MSLEEFFLAANWFRDDSVLSLDWLDSSSVGADDLFHVRPLVIDHLYILVFPFFFLYWVFLSLSLSLSFSLPLSVYTQEKASCFKWEEMVNYKLSISHELFKKVEAQDLVKKKVTILFRKGEKIWHLWDSHHTLFSDFEYFLINNIILLQVAHPKLLSQNHWVILHKCRTYWAEIYWWEIKYFIKNVCAFLLNTHKMFWD